MIVKKNQQLSSEGIMNVKLMSHHIKNRKFPTHTNDQMVRINGMSEPEMTSCIHHPI